MKQQTLMKSLVAALTVSVSATLANADGGALDDGVNLTVNRVQQRYPWNGLVDIDYTIVVEPGVTLGPDDNLEVQMIDESVSPAVTNRAVRFLQAPLPMTAGTHRITWDAQGDGVTNHTDNALFVVKIAHYVPAYMVINIKEGKNAKYYPVTFMNGEPEGGFNTDEYKGEKIVLRRIHPGSYMAGSPSAPEPEANRTPEREVQHPVALSQSFYIGIFEVTQLQYAYVTGFGPSKFTGNYRPVEQVSYDTIRGQANPSTHLYDWPWTNAVSGTSFMGLLRAKCKSKDSDGNYTVDVKGFDLPTEFQWECACRAGTRGAFNTTNSYENTTEAQTEQLKLLGRCQFNKSEGKGGYNSDHTKVGSYMPNAWGLYDMHGNVWEWCLDWYRQDVEKLGQTGDPIGEDSGTERVFRGGCYTYGVGGYRSAWRGFSTPDKGYEYGGFRLCRTLP